MSALQADLPAQTAQRLQGYRAFKSAGDELRATNPLAGRERSVLGDEYKSPDAASGTAGGFTPPAFGAGRSLRFASGSDEAGPKTVADMKTDTGPSWMHDPAAIVAGGTAGASTMNFFEKSMEMQTTSRPGAVGVSVDRSHNGGSGVIDMMNGAGNQSNLRSVDLSERSMAEKPPEPAAPNRPNLDNQGGPEADALKTQALARLHERRALAANDAGPTPEAPKAEPPRMQMRI